LGLQPWDQLPLLVWSLSSAGAIAPSTAASDLDAALASLCAPLAHRCTSAQSRPRSTLCWGCSGTQRRTALSGRATSRSLTATGAQRSHTRWVLGVVVPSLGVTVFWGDLCCCKHTHAPSLHDCTT
jgi:hypothetical protein